MPFAVFTQNPLGPVAALLRNRGYALGVSLAPPVGGGNDIFALKNGPDRTLRMCVELCLGFMAVAPLASVQGFRLRRFTGTAATGGTDAKPFIQRLVGTATDLVGAPSTVADVRFAAVLGAPTVIEAKDIRVMLCQRNGAAIYHLPETVIDIAPAEGITLQSLAAGDANDLIAINLTWYEVGG